MIHPSYTELMEAINEGSEMEDQPLVTSRYSSSSCYKQESKAADRRKRTYGPFRRKKNLCLLR